MGNKKQHILAETYLKHFSPKKDGKNLSVLHLLNSFKDGVQKYDSGNKVFWKDKFYNSSEFENPKTVELFLGSEIESKYNRIIESLNSQQTIEDNNFKMDIFEWLFYSKLRSPIWRVHFQQQFRNNGHVYRLESKELREGHMAFFSSPKVFDYFKQEYLDWLIIKKWKVLINPQDCTWITSDNPGVAVNMKEFALERENYFPNGLWNNIVTETALYFPLSSEFCLEIFPYSNEDDVKQNLGTEKIKIEKTSSFMAQFINLWTAQSAFEIIVGTTDNSLTPFLEFAVSAKTGQTIE